MNPLSYRFDKKMNAGYTFSLEYNYGLSEKLSLAAESGIENTYYTPTHASLIKYPENSPESDLPYVQEITYADNLTNYLTYTHGNTWDPTYIPDYQRPQIRIKETLRLNSLFVGINLRYNIDNK